MLRRYGSVSGIRRLPTCFEHDYTRNTVLVVSCLDTWLRRGIRSLALRMWGIAHGYRSGKRLRDIARHGDAGPRTLLP